MPDSGRDLLFLTEDRIREHVELMFFAYRSFTHDPDEILAARGLGRAHHRALHFIRRDPGLTVSDLLAVLAVTKQSLNRVLRTLIDEGYVISKQGTEDRRERLLTLTEAGLAFEGELARAQQARVRAAFANSGPEAVNGFNRVLRELVDPALQPYLRDYGVNK